MFIGSHKAAGVENFEMANFQNGASPEFNPINMFKQDQQSTPVALDNTFVWYQGKKYFTDFTWPIGEIVNEEDWLESAFEATGAVGMAAMLFIYHKQHKLMDYIPKYLANPGFMNANGEALKATLTKFMSGNVRNDILYRYQRLLQIHPIMFDTMPWLDTFHQDAIGSKLYRFGIPDAFGYIKPENVTTEMIHEAIGNAKTNAAKRLVPPSTSQFIEMYAQLLIHKGEELVSTGEIVQIALMDWKLAYSYIRAKELDFNTALSILMTFMYKRGTDVSAYDNYVIIEKLFNDYGPSDQWPTLANVMTHVNATTGGKAATQQAAHPASSLGTSRINVNQQPTASQPFE